MPNAECRMNDEAQMMKPTYHEISPRVLTDEKPGHRVFATID
jgi:hypothetical protein